MINHEAPANREIDLKKSFSPQEMRIEVLPKLEIECDPNNILRRLNKKLSGLVDRNGVAASDKEAQKLLSDATMILGLDNHHPLVQAIKADYRPLAIEFANNLVDEYNCKTPSEKALIHTVVNSYIRLVDDSRRYQNCSDAGEYISIERTKHLAMLSKQMDRANRQLISAITALRQLKSPPIQISVKTNTAFIAQNQQLNNNSTTNETNSL